MRKTLSIILSVMMILSICSFAIPASAAPEGTAINTADEFMAMVSTPADATEVSAKYYLASDITLAGTYTEPFWGVLDGNGHTVTVSNPMFADFSGEVSNLTIKGDIYYTDADAAAFTVISTKGFNATNCTNDANVTVTGLGIWGAGFVCSATKTAEPLVFTNCVNNGDVYIDSTGPEKMRAGGFGGIIDTCIFYDCTNNGDIYVKGGIPIAGGFVGRISLNVGMNTVEAYNCTNNGNVTVVETYLGTDGVTLTDGKSDAAGFFGYVGGSGNAGWYKAWGCVNNGNIDGPYRIGGFFGYVYASNSNAFADVQFCINNGNLTYGRTQAKDDATVLYDFCGPFIAYTNSPFTTIKYCIDTGAVTRREGTISANDGRSFVGLSSSDGSQYDIKGVYVLNKEQYKWMTWASDDKYIANRVPIEEAEGIIVTTLEDIKSGKACYEINALADQDDYGFAGSDTDTPFYFYQKIGTDNFPTSDATHGWVVLDNGTYANGEKPVVTEPETTKAPETQAPETKAPETDPETEAPVEGTDAPATEAPTQTTEAPKSEGGCGGFIAGGVAIVAILGTALIIKKRD